MLPTYWPPALIDVKEVISQASLPRAHIASDTKASQRLKRHLGRTYKHRIITPLSRLTTTRRSLRGPLQITIRRPYTPRVHIETAAGPDAPGRALPQGPSPPGTFLGPLQRDPRAHCAWEPSGPACRAPP